MSSQLVFDIINLYSSHYNAIMYIHTLVCKLNLISSIFEGKFEWVTRTATTSGGNCVYCR